MSEAAGAHHRGDPSQATSDPNMFETAEWYDRTVNWDARLRREIPLLCDVFGPPGDGGILDAGCGPGRQAIALADKGYAVTAVGRVQAHDRGGPAARPAMGGTG